MAEFRLSNFTDGGVLTAAELNTGLTYADYTPTWTQVATITKTVNWARYTQFGKMVTGSVKMTASSAGTSGSVIKCGLPVNASSNNFMMGTFSCVDVSKTPDSIYRGFAVYDSASTVSFYVTNVDAYSAINETLRFGQVNASSDVAENTLTIASGDIIYIHFSYEAA